MRLCDFPFTPTDDLFDGTGGIHQEPTWFGLSLAALFLALFCIPHRRQLLTGSVATFAIKLWLVYRALEAWVRLNESEASQAASDRAPFAAYNC